MGKGSEKAYGKSQLCEQRKEAMLKWTDCVDILVIEREYAVVVVIDG